MRINVETLREEKGATMAVNMVEEFPPVDLTRSELVFVEPVRFTGQAIQYRAPNCGDRGGLRTRSCNV